MPYRNNGILLHFTFSNLACLFFTDKKHTLMIYVLIFSLAINAVLCMIIAYSYKHYRRMVNMNKKIQSYLSEEEKIKLAA